MKQKRPKRRYRIISAQEAMAIVGKIAHDILAPETLHKRGSKKKG